jgi:small conductance mechanosensitive channel
MTTETNTEASNATDQVAFDIPSIDELNWDTLVNYDYSGVSELIVTYSMQILAAGAIFFIGRWVVRRLVNVVKKGLSKTKMDPTLVGFLGNILFGIGLVFVIVAAMSQVGIDTTSFAAAIAAAGLAIGLALQGSLSNFAAGFLIILFGFFKKGDYIEAAGTAGSVEEISIFTTTLLTPDNRTIIIPNGNITTDNIINYTANKRRRLDLVIGVAYDADLKKTQKLLMKVITGHEKVLTNPEPIVEVNELGASSVDFIVRPWVKTEDLWQTKWDLMKDIKIELDKAGIGIPFPQRDVHLFIEDGQTLPIKTSKAKTTAKKK